MKKQIKIVYDGNMEYSNPRKCTNLGTMICKHYKYSLGDVDGDEPVPDRDFEILQLYLYDHSGLRISSEPFTCPWDSGVVGYIYVYHDTIREWYGDVNEDTIQKARYQMLAEVRTYDLFLSGNVFTVLIRRGEEEECVNGFIITYGDKTLGGMLDYIPEDMHEAAREAFNNIGEWVDVKGEVG